VTNNVAKLPQKFPLIPETMVLKMITAFKNNMEFQITFCSRFYLVTKTQPEKKIPCHKKITMQQIQKDIIVTPIIHTCTYAIVISLYYKFQKYYFNNFPLQILTKRKKLKIKITS